MPNDLTPIERTERRVPRSRRDRRPFLVSDPRMLEVLELARRLSEVETSVLIQGETGVGKDAIAERIHQASPRAAGPFVRLNCAALPASLLESELFGSVRGAFTGADRNSVGYVEAADGGTLFLDEIGELSVVAQVKLLNVLETREIRRVGSIQSRRVDVRLISATHRDLEAAVEHKTFRGDLYYRISGFRLVIPPLRDRPSEIGVLAERFVLECAERDGAAPLQIHSSTLSALLGHAWPGNVRELRNAIEYGVVLAESGVILPEHLPPSVYATRVAGGVGAGGRI